MHNCDALPFGASLLPDPLALRDDRFADPERASQGFRAVRDRKHAAETGGANNRRAPRHPVAARLTFQQKGRQSGTMATVAISGKDEVHDPWHLPHG